MVGYKCVVLVYSDGQAAYEVPSKWRVQRADRIAHKPYPHNDPRHPFVHPVDRDRHSQRVETINSLIKTLTLFPQRGSYEPHLSCVLQEFAFHRDDGNSKLIRYV